LLLTPAMSFFLSRDMTLSPARHTIAARFVAPMLRVLRAARHAR